MPQKGIEEFRVLWRAAKDAGALVKMEFEAVGAKLPEAAKPPPLCIYSDDFLAFWKTIPNKIGKGSAWKAWQNLLKEGVTALAIQKGVPVLIQHEKARQRANKDDYSPLHPSTWLNGRRFEDEVGTDLSAPKLSKTEIAAKKCEDIMKLTIGGADRAALSACLSEGMTVEDITANQHLFTEGKALSHFFYEVAEIVNK